MFCRVDAIGLKLSPCFNFCKAKKLSYQHHLDSLTWLLHYLDQISTGSAGQDSGSWVVLIQGLLGGFGQDVGGVCHYLKAQLGLKDVSSFAHVY